MSERAVDAARSGDVHLVSEATLLGTGTVRSVSGGPPTEARTLDIVAGNISVSATDPIRRAFDATLVDRLGGLVPSALTDPLMPFGAEVAITAGFEFPDGTRELWPQGVFIITDVEVADEGSSLLIDVEGSDRAERFSRPSATPDSIAAGTPLALAIQQLLAKVWPEAAFALGNMTYTAPNLLIAENESRWDKGIELAKAGGHELYLDVLGRVGSRPVPALSASSTPAWVFSDETGDEDSGPERRPTLTALRRAIHAEDMPNGVVVSGNNTSLGTPVRGEAWDDDPLSPTYRRGRYGERPHFESSDKVTSNDQARDMAQGLLNQMLGQSEELDLPAITLPALDVGDVVLVDRPRAGVDRRLFMVDTISLPLAGDETMSLSARSRVVDVLR